MSPWPFFKEQFQLQCGIGAMARPGSKPALVKWKVQPVDGEYSYCEIGLLCHFGVIGRFPFTKRFQKFRLGCKWNMIFRFVPLENFWKKWNF